MGIPSGVWEQQAHSAGSPAAGVQPPAVLTAPRAGGSVLRGCHRQGLPAHCLAAPCGVGVELILTGRAEDLCSVKSSLLQKKTQENPKVCC